MNTFNRGFIAGIIGFMIFSFITKCSDNETEQEQPDPVDVMLTITYLDKPSETCIFSYFKIHGPVTTIENGCSTAIFPTRCGVKSIQVVSDPIKLRCY